MNQCTWLRLPWLPGPTVSLSPAQRQGSQIWRCELQRYPVKYCSTEVQRGAAAARQRSYLTRGGERLCWPRPLANLGCTVYWAISINPSRCQLLPRSLSLPSAQFFTPHPPVLFHLTPLSFIPTFSPLGYSNYRWVSPSIQLLQQLKTSMTSYLPSNTDLLMF